MLKKIDQVLGRINAEWSLQVLKAVAGLCCKLPGDLGKAAKQSFMLVTSPEYQDLVRNWGRKGYLRGLWKSVTVSQEYRQFIADGAEIQTKGEALKFRIVELIRSGNYGKAKLR